MTNSIDAYSYLENADKKSRSGDYQSAIDNYIQAIEIFLRVESKEEDSIDFSDFLEAYNGKADLHILLEEYKEAIIDLQKIINQKIRLKTYIPCQTFYQYELHPGNEFLLIGLCKYQLEDYQSAISHLNKAIKAFKSSLSTKCCSPHELCFCYILRGEVRHIRGDIKQANKDWKLALDLDGLAQALSFDTPIQNFLLNNFEEWLSSNYQLPNIANEFKKYCTNI